jgi:hypothetical protein
VPSSESRGGLVLDSSHGLQTCGHMQLRVPVQGIIGDII